MAYYLRKHFKAGAPAPEPVKGRVRAFRVAARDYPLNRILDMCLSLEDHTVQLTPDGRKNPVILSMPDIATFAGKLRQVVAME